MQRLLLAEVQAAALTEHRSVDEVLEDAVKKYLDERSWMNLVQYGRERAISTAMRVTKARPGDY